MNYVVYWRYGDYTIIEGSTIEEAFTKSGYGLGATAAIDFYEEFNAEKHPKYCWEPEEKNWILNTSKRSFTLHVSHDVGENFEKIRTVEKLSDLYNDVKALSGDYTRFYITDQNYKPLRFTCFEKHDQSVEIFDKGRMVHFGNNIVLIE